VHAMKTSTCYTNQRGRMTLSKYQSLYSVLAQSMRTSNAFEDWNVLYEVLELPSPSFPYVAFSSSYS